MRKFSVVGSMCLALFSIMAKAQWQKINDVDYIWGPFTIYNIALFSETGSYEEGIRPLMLRLHYQKPVDGRDFAISLARSWSNLGITLPEQEQVVDKLRKVIPNIKKGDKLSYIALPDKGYFVLNDRIIETEFNQDFNNAVVSVWLDPRVEIGRALLDKEQSSVEMPKSGVKPSEGVAENHSEPKQAVGSFENIVMPENSESEQPVEIWPPNDPISEQPLG